ncbi:MAG: hypothetical protein LBG76_00255 [Treponema sp.]|nr:hypothetical protein [Treponema sp.]
MITIESVLQVLVFGIIGLVFLWVASTIFFRADRKRETQERRERKPAKNRLLKTGAPQKVSEGSKTCPVCSSKLPSEERVRSAVFPGSSHQGRLMQIFGCIYCLNEGRPRKCPVCGAAIKSDEYLIARLFEKPDRSHVHVLGCNRCRGPGAARPAPTGS